MEYYLMHKDIELCFMDMSEDGKMSRIRRNPSAIEHIPLAGQMNDMRLIQWWKDRAIPKTRQGAKTALQRLGYSSTENVLLDNLGLSLNDCYWIKPRKSGITWDEVNLFKNNFVDSFGELTFDQNASVDVREHTKFMFATSQGELQKKWCIDSETGKRFLVKGNYGNSYQQSLNEIFACSIHKALDFSEYTKYYLTHLTTETGESAIGCYSYNFCSEDVEAVPAWEVLQLVKFKENESLYYPFKKLCLELGMSENYFDYFIEYQIMTDFLITNTDRHMNNISILRNPNTLELIGFAPIYDSGNSMFYKKNIDDINKTVLGQDKTHSFITAKEVRLLKYVQNRNLVDLNKIPTDFSVYKRDIPENLQRIQPLKEKFERKILMLDAFQRGKDIWKEFKGR